MKIGFKTIAVLVLLYGAMLVLAGVGWSDYLTAQVEAQDARVEISRLSGQVKVLSLQSTALSEALQTTLVQKYEGTFCQMTDRKYLDGATDICRLGVNERARKEVAKVVGDAVHKR
jgi:hypothetical protein